MQWKIQVRTNLMRWYILPQLHQVGLCTNVAVIIYGKTQDKQPSFRQCCVDAAVAQWQNAHKYAVAHGCESCSGTIFCLTFFFRLSFPLIQLKVTKQHVCVSRELGQGQLLMYLVLLPIQSVFVTFMPQSQYAQVQESSVLPVTIRKRLRLGLITSDDRFCSILITVLLVSNVMSTLSS